MRIKLAAIFLLLSFSCFGSNMEQGKVETQKLFDAVLPIAQQLLLENEEFFPFGEIMKPNGEQVNLSASNGEDSPKSSDLIDLLKNHYIEAAQSNEIIASALVYDVVVNGSDSIAVDLDHVSGYSVTVVVPYELTETELIIGQMFTVKGKRLIFK
ncbi:hypothetical protein SHAQ108633_05050 [Shewanella aquimarina]